MKKKSIGKLNCIIYFEEQIETSFTKDALGGFSTLWIPALGEIVDTAEAGTTTTNIAMTAHGMETGDYIINTSRSNNVKEVTKLNANNVTIGAITGQTSGDTIKKRLYSASRVWASIITKNQNYYIENQQKTPRVTHTIEIRYRDDINTKMRVKYGTRYFEIISIVNVEEAKQRISLECRELIT